MKMEQIVFRNVGIQQSGAGEIPKRIHTKYFVARQQCKGNSLLHFHYKNKHLYIVGSYTYANSNQIERVVSCPWQQWLRESATL